MTGAAIKLVLAVPLLEASNASAGIKNLLLTGVERVAGRAHVRAKNAFDSGAAGLERVSASARDLRNDVFGVNVLLHGVLSWSPGQHAARAVNRNLAPIVPASP